MKIKRAQGTTLTWAFALPCILVLMVGFLVITMALSGKSKTEISFKESVENLDSQRELIKILNSPVDIEESKNVKELIKLWFSDKSKYEDILDSEMKKVLEDFEYEYVDSQIKNLRVRGFSLLIYSEKHVKGGGMPKELIRIASEKYDGGFVVTTAQGNVELAGVYIPVSETNMVYVVLWGSQEAKDEK